jgi:hypothetical protein
MARIVLGERVSVPVSTAHAKEPTAMASAGVGVR